jgi:transcriptional regulator with XRE-family HTH domain
LNYEKFKIKLKEINVTNKDFAEILGIDKTTPSAYWKKKNEVPKHVEVILELLKNLSLEKRLVYIHEKSKEI